MPLHKIFHEVTNLIFTTEGGSKSLLGTRHTVLHLEHEICTVLECTSTVYGTSTGTEHSAERAHQDEISAIFDWISAASAMSSLSMALSSCLLRSVSIWALSDSLIPFDTSRSSSWRPVGSGASCPYTSTKSAKRVRHQYRSHGFTDTFVYCSGLGREQGTQDDLKWIRRCMVV